VTLKSYSAENASFPRTAPPFGVKEPVQISSPTPGGHMGITSPFLKGFEAVDIKAILAAATTRQFIAKTVVTHQGDAATRLFLLIRGRARYFFITEEGRKHILHWLLPGEVFGFMAVLSTPSPYLVSTEMVRDSQVLMWDRNTIRSLAARYPRLLDNSLWFATQYLTLYLAAHVALTCQTGRQRLAHTLVNLTRTCGEHVPGGIELDVSNEELANAANVTVFTVSRLLREWHRRHAIRKTRGKVLLKRAEQLFQQ
jgi:CRP/FNR family transcriptional regulator, nitrogen oxide reductase regulator